MHRFSIGTQSQEAGPVARQIVCGGQLPPHSPAESGALHGWSVVVVVLLLLVVVVVVGLTTVFSTGAHRSCGRPTRMLDSRPNWSSRLTTKLSFLNPLSVVHAGSTQVLAATL
jgi:hypothetical protein